MNTITRRAALGGMASLPATVATALPSFATETASQRCIRLAEELSAELSNLDGGQWKMSVRPLLEGKPNVHVEPLYPVREKAVEKSVERVRDLAREDLLNAYSQWLHYEHRMLYRDIYSTPEMAQFWADRCLVPMNTGAQNYHNHLFRHWDSPEWGTLATPATRAALVLATVGCDLRPLDEQA